MPPGWDTSSEASAAVELKGRPKPWGAAGWCFLLVFLGVGLWLRLRGLAVEGFADDEVHKWLAANRYLHGDFGGDDIEHPMLMKWLIALCVLIGSRLSWEPETIVRLPGALAGGLSILAIAYLGRRLFGRAAGLWAAALAAVSVTFIGYQRVAKEDTFLGLFLTLLMACVAEAKAAADDGRERDQKRWEWLGAFSMAAMMASKYFLFFAPIPVFCYLWLLGTGTRWRIPVRRWALLIAGALLLFAAINWTPFMPSSWAYGLSYMAEKRTIHGSLYFMGRIFHNLPSWGLKGTPVWFYLVFAAVKLAPPTLFAAGIGLGLSLWQRRASHRVILTWMGYWFLLISISGSKWGRFFTHVLPVFVILAGYAFSVLVSWVREASARAFATRTVVGFAAPRQEIRQQFARNRWPGIVGAAAMAALGAVMVGTEARAAWTHAPHYRLYISALGGGDGNVSWFFPHCDYFDAGFREAIAYIAAHAEPNAELSTEIDLSAKYYSERFGRPDLYPTLVRHGEACRDGRTCYVVVQTGRLYFLNQDAVSFLADREPWYVERIRGVDVVKVYRLMPGESPFPGERPAAAGTFPKAETLH